MGMSPKKLIKNMATNQSLSPLLADFQRAIPFHEASQTISKKILKFGLAIFQSNIKLLYHYSFECVKTSLFDP